MHAPVSPFSLTLQFSAKMLPNNRFSLKNHGLAPPVWEILDPPLQMLSYDSHRDQLVKELAYAILRELWPFN